MVTYTKALMAEPTYQFPPGSSWVQMSTDKWVTVDGIFENATTNNHWHSERKNAGGRDIGSNWTAIKSSYSRSSVQVDHQQRFSGVWFGYRGPLLIHSSNHFTGQNFLDLPDGHTSDIDLMGLGTTAISRVLPTNPASDVPTGLAELYREGIPGLLAKGKFLEGLDGIGNPAGGYLGYEFGLKPFLDELLAFADATRNAENIINQYARNSGKLIRRRYEFPAEYETSEDVVPNLGGATSAGYLGGLAQLQCKDFLRSSYGGNPGTRTDFITREKNTWFSGAFTYFLPEVGSKLSDQLYAEYAEMRRLYGGISVSTAWNLLPYSWAADWVTNAGDVLKNIEAFSQDGLVMNWGYIMERCTFHVRRQVEGARLSQNYLASPYFPIPTIVSNTFEKKYQRRRAATPFGFGLDVDGFTDRQKAISISLGISKIF